MNPRGFVPGVDLAQLSPQPGAPPRPHAVHPAVRLHWSAPGDAQQHAGSNARQRACARRLVRLALRRRVQRQPRRAHRSKT
jgi:hypothetical protein